MTAGVVMSFFFPSKITLIFHPSSAHDCLTYGAAAGHQGPQRRWPVTAAPGLAHGPRTRHASPDGHPPARRLSDTCPSTSNDSTDRSANINDVIRSTSPTSGTNVSQVFRFMHTKGCRYLHSERLQMKNAALSGHN